MIEFMIYKSQLMDFEEIGYTEFYSEESSNLFKRLLDSERLEYKFIHGTYPMGESWYFEKVKN